METDGVRTGYDVGMLAAVRAAVTIPIVASGGAGTPAHFVDAVDAGADACLAASVFHFQEFTIGAAKQALAAAGHTIR
jgi:cyclase